MGHKGPNNSIRMELLYYRKKHKCVLPPISRLCFTVVTLGIELEQIVCPTAYYSTLKTVSIIR